MTVPVYLSRPLVGCETRSGSRSCRPRRLRRRHHRTTRARLPSHSGLPQAMERAPRPARLARQVGAQGAVAVVEQRVRLERSSPGRMPRFTRAGTPPGSAGPVSNPSTVSPWVNRGRRGCSARSSRTPRRIGRCRGVGGWRVAHVSYLRSLSVGETTRRAFSIFDFRCSTATSRMKANHCRPPKGNPFEARVQLRYVRSSDAAATSFVENYVGLPWR